MDFDWELLRRQKAWMVSLADEMGSNRDAWTQNDIDMVDGLIHMIDAVQDDAIDKGWDSAKIFGELA